MAVAGPASFLRCGRWVVNILTCADGSSWASHLKNKVRKQSFPPVRSGGGGSLLTSCLPVE